MSSYVKGTVTAEISLAQKCGCAADPVTSCDSYLYAIF